GEQDWLRHPNQQLRQVHVPNQPRGIVAVAYEYHGEENRLHQHATDPGTDDTLRLGSHVSGIGTEAPASQHGRPRVPGALLPWPRGASMSKRAYDVRAYGRRGFN